MGMAPHSYQRIHRRPQSVLPCPAGGRRTAGWTSGSWRGHCCPGTT